MNIFRLSWDLQKASLAARTGTGVVSGLAILSLTVCSWIAFIVAGGTWMFWERKQASLPLPVPVHESRDPGQILTMYVALALIACAFLVPAIFALTSQAAVLGASGRERRLAALRLLGLTSGDITRMTAFDTGLQAIFGIGLGLLLALISAPLGAKFTFQGTPLTNTDLFLPWWGYVVVAGILFLLALVSSIIGMQRVRVSPLGVARREMPKALKWWRLILTAAVIVIGLGWLRSQTPSTNTGFLIGMAIAIFTMISVLNLGMPFLLQLWFRIVGLLPGTHHFVATRRIVTDARSAWRRCSATAFYGVLVGVLVISPRGNDGFSQVFKDDQELGMMYRDLNNGTMITVVIGFIIAAVATLLGQASEVFEKAALSRALYSLGVPRRFHFVVAAFQILGPIVLVSLCGFVLGAGMMLTIFGQAGDLDAGPRLVNAFIFLLAGWLLTVLALLAVEPLRNRVLTYGGRRND